MLKKVGSFIKSRFSKESYIAAAWFGFVAYVAAEGVEYFVGDGMNWSSDSSGVDTRVFPALAKGIYNFIQTGKSSSLSEFSMFLLPAVFIAAILAFLYGGALLKRRSFKRAFLTGFLLPIGTTTISLLVTFLAISLFHLFEISSLGDLMAALRTIPGVLYLSIFANILTGWITAPLGIGAAIILNLLAPKASKV